MECSNGHDNTVYYGGRSEQKSCLKLLSISDSLSHEHIMRYQTAYIKGYGDFDCLVWFSIFCSWDKQPEINGAEQTKKRHIPIIQLMMSILLESTKSDNC